MQQSESSPHPPPDALSDAEPFTARAGAPAQEPSSESLPEPSSGQTRRSILNKVSIAEPEAVEVTGTSGSQLDPSLRSERSGPGAPALARTLSSASVRSGRKRSGKGSKRGGSAQVPPLSLLATVPAPICTVPSRPMNDSLPHLAGL